MDDYENIENPKPPGGKATFDLSMTNENEMRCPPTSSNRRFISTYLLMKREERKQVNLPISEKRFMKF